MSQDGKVYVKLRDKGIIFHDASQEQSITGTAVVGFRRSPKVLSAIKNGLLIEQTDYKPEAPKEDKAPATTDAGIDKNYSKWNKAKLQEELTARGLEFDPEATNAQLAELLVNNDEESEEK